MPDAWEVPSGWLLAALVAPTVLGVLPLAAPRAVVACASALGHTDATVPVSALSLLLSLARILSVLQWWLAGPAPERQPQPRWLLVLRLGVALPLLALGVAIKWGAWRALPREHMFYGRQLGRATGPWCTSWPYDATAHPWESASCLVILGLLTLQRRGVAGTGWVAVSWLGAHLASAVLEEGLASPLAPHMQHAALPEGAHPFYDGNFREMSVAEHLRVVFMMPAAFLRCCCFWSGIALYGLFVNAVYAAVKDERKRHKLLVPGTRLAAGGVLWACGFTLRVRGRAHLTAAQRHVADTHGAYLVVSNHLSYMDILVAAAVLGPYAAAARHDLLDWPVVGPVARSWGVIGVVQSAIRERELRATSGGGASGSSGSLEGGAADALTPPATPPLVHACDAPSDSSAGGPPGTDGASARGAAAALCARARLPGSGHDLPPVLVFPEATTSAGGCLVSFRSGAFVAGVPVLPLTLRYSTPTGFNLSWCSPHTTGGHFLRSMCAWGKTVEVDLLPLHLPSPEELQDATAFANSVRASMAAQLGWPALEGWSVREAHQLHHDLARAQQTGQRVSLSALLQTRGAKNVSD